MKKPLTIDDSNFDVLYPPQMLYDSDNNCICGVKSPDDAREIAVAVNHHNALVELAKLAACYQTPFTEASYHISTAARELLDKIEKDKEAAQ